MQRELAAISTETAPCRSLVPSIDSTSTKPSIYAGETSTARAALTGDKGRYTQADPIGLAAGENLFAYVGSSPLVGVDPLGLFDSRDVLDAMRGGARMGLWDAAHAALLGKDAFDEADRRYPVPPRSNRDFNNAYRHCLWSCLLFESINSNDAYDALNTHEQGRLDDLDHRKDVFNNERGRSLANTCKKAKDCYQACLTDLTAGNLATSDADARSRGLDRTKPSTKLPGARYFP